MKNFLVIGLIFSILFVAGCITPVDPNNGIKPEIKEKGNLVLSITDKEVEGLQELNVTISLVEIHKAVKETEQNQIKEKLNCEIGKEYINNAVDKVECECPEGYEFETVSTGFGPCPEEGMTDCHQTTIKCMVKTQEQEQNEDSDSTGEWIVFSSEEKTFDLMQLKSSEGLKDLLGKKELTDGKYTQIRLTVTKVTALINGKEFEVEVPSGTIKLVKGFTITAGQKTELILDFSPESVIKTGKTYKLKPVIKVLTEKEFKERQTKEKETEIEFSFVESGNQSGVTEAKNVIVTSQQEWQELYNEIYSIQTPVPALPEINFEEKTVIAVFLGEKNNPQFGIDIEKVTELKNQIKVFAEETFTELGEGEAGIQITVQPYAVISIPKTEKEIKVFWKTATQNQNFCETNSDCACGKNKQTGECFYGNKEFVDTEKQCPDFCSGIAGNLTIKCSENKCKQFSFTKMTEEQAREIAQISECINEGNLKENANYNESTKTWWIDLDAKKSGCNPACVVSEETNKAEINWRCTGLITEPVVDSETFLEQECDGVMSCPEGYECAKFPGIGLKCYPLTESNPCNFVECSVGSDNCIVAESYPVQVICN